MAETAGLVGLGLQLWKTSMELYTMFSEMQGFSSDKDDYHWRITTEQHRLKIWEEAWGICDGTLTKKLDPNEYGYRYALATLSRIAALFASATSLDSKYGIKVVNSAATSAQNAPSAPTRRKRDKMFELLRIRKKPPKPSKVLSALQISSPGLISSLDSNGIEVLQNPTVLENKTLVVGLEDEIVKIDGATRELQQMIPTYKKFKWVVADRAKYLQLAEMLEKYNDGLWKVLPPPEKQLAPPAPPAFLKFNIPFQLQVQRNRKFVGRVDLLDKIHKILDPSQNKNQQDRRSRVAVLHGMGGMGKTQIVTEYAYHYSASYTSIFWVDATTKATLAHSSLMMMEQIISHYQSKWHDSAPNFAEIEIMLGLSAGIIKSTGEIREECPPELITRAVKKWLSHQENDQWLVVFDNFDNIESIKMSDFFPKCHFGSIIVSTRRPEAAHYGDGIEIGGIEKKSGISIVLSSAGKDPQLSDGPDYEEASKIAEKLGYLPLALEQAGAYISAMDIEIASYLPLFNTNFKNLALANHPQLSEMYRSDTVFTTWKISYERLPAVGRNLLSLCAFLVNGNQEVPQEFFNRAKGYVSWLPLQSEFVELGTKSLLSFSMAKRKTYQNEKSLCFHPLILEWTRDKLGVDERRVFTMRAIALLAGCIRSTNTGLDGSSSAPSAEFERGIFPYIDVIIRYLQTLPDAGMLSLEREFANAVVEIGVFLVNYSKYKEAEEILLKSLEFHEEIANHETMIYEHDYHRALSNLGWVYYNRNRTDESIVYFERALSGQEQMYGKDSPDTVDTLGRMSIVLSARGDHKAALEVQDRVVSGLEKSRGKEHYETLNATLVKAELLGRGGDPVEAEVFLRQILARLEEARGKTHPTTLRAVGALAWDIQRQGSERLHDAMGLYNSVLATQEEILGPQHPETLRTVSSMGQVYKMYGRLDEALKLYELLCKCWKIEFGIEHPDTLSAIWSIAEIRKAQKKYQEALGLYQQVLVGEEMVSGKESSHVCNALYEIGTCFHTLGKYGDATDWFKRLLVIQERVLGDEDFNTLKTIKSLVRSLNEDGKVRSLNEDGKVRSLHGAGKLEEAFALLERIMPAQEKLFGKTHGETLRVRSEMAHNVAAQGRYQEALDMWQNILAIQEEVLGKDDPHTLNSMNSLAMVMKHFGRYQEAFELLERAITGYEKIYGPNDPATLRALWSMSLAKHDNGESEEALELIQRSAVGLETALGREDPEVFVVASVHAQFLDDKGEHKEAAELYKRVLDGRRRLFGPDDPRTISTAIELSKVEVKLE